VNLVLTSDPSELPSLEKIPPFSIIVFDDFSNNLDFLQLISSIIAYTRHYFVSIFILTHSWTKLDRSLVRANCNYFLIFSSDIKTLQHIHDEHLSNLISFDNLKKLTKLAWTEHRTFLLVDLEASSNKQFRFGFDTNIELQND
jgi:hypothetical protein